MSFLSNYSGINSNFWTENPQLLIPLRFAELYDSDTSEGKKQSSNIMFAICFYIDPSEENKFKNIPEEDRKRLIAKDFLKNVNFPWNEYEDLIDYCKNNFILTQAERSLYEHEKQMYDRDIFLSGTPWDLETGDKKDKMLANTEKLYQSLNRIKEAVKQETVKSRDKGGSKPTGSDLGTM